VLGGELVEVVARGLLAGG